MSSLLKEVYSELKKVSADEWIEFAYSFACWLIGWVLAIAVGFTFAYLIAPQLAIEQEWGVWIGVLISLIVRRVWLELSY